MFLLNVLFSVLSYFLSLFSLAFCYQISVSVFVLKNHDREAKAMNTEKENQGLDTSARALMVKSANHFSNILI